ncbi:hypothetical protein [Aureimonas endophytica]|uniref:hypothetical protein n=1 Tax=Aureimonas endophytica TaxID=2027858 RepID=UPI0016661A42|nr:hypothetical protein [Aureimonas endophytica]
MAKAKTAEPKPEDGGEAKPARSRKKKGIIAAAAALVLAGGAGAGGYFAFGTASEASPAPEHAAAKKENKGPLAVAVLTDAAPLQPADYAIVSIFENEAILATRLKLVRIKVGSVVTGLGTITAIEAGDNGLGTVTGTDATLKAG